MSTKHGGRGGVIVNMSSVAARTGGLSGGAAYAATKGAMDSFTIALAKEVGTEGIRVNAIRPGLIATEIHDAHGGLEQMERLAKAAVPLGRSGSPLKWQRPRSGWHRAVLHTCTARSLTSPGDVRHAVVF